MLCYALFEMKCLYLPYSIFIHIFNFRRLEQSLESRPRRSSFPTVENMYNITMAAVLTAFVVLFETVAFTVCHVTFCAIKAFSNLHSTIGEWCLDRIWIWQKRQFFDDASMTNVMKNYHHHHHRLLLLGLKVDIHFTIPPRVEGWVDLDGWLHTETVYLPASSQSPIPVVNGLGVD